MERALEEVQLRDIGGSFHFVVSQAIISCCRQDKRSMDEHHARST